MNSDAMSNSQPDCLFCNNPMQDVTEPGPQDSQCSCCHDSLVPGQPVRMHIACGHVWHTRCIQEWIDHCRTTGIKTTCPICRELIERFPYRPPPILDLNFTSRYNMSDIQDPLRRHVRMTFLPGDTILHRLGSFDSSVNTTIRIAIVGQYHLKDPTPGSEVFYDKKSTWHSVMVFEYCSHGLEGYLLTGETIYQCVSAAYLQGYCPTACRLVPRVHAERGTTLPQLIAKAKRMDAKMVEIPYIQLAHLFPDFEPFQQRTKLFITIERTTHEDGVQTYKAWVAALCPDATSPGPDHHKPLDEAATLDLVDKMGGLGPNIAVVFNENSEDAQTRLRAFS